MITSARFLNPHHVNTRRYKLDTEGLELVSSPHADPYNYIFSCGRPEAGENRVSLQDISEVREGWETDIFNKINNDPSVLER